MRIVESGQQGKRFTGLNTFESSRQQGMRECSIYMLAASVSSAVRSEGMWHRHHQARRSELGGGNRPYINRTMPAAIIYKAAEWATDDRCQNQSAAYLAGVPMRKTWRCKLPFAPILACLWQPIPGTIPHTELRLAVETNFRKLFPPTVTKADHAP